MHKKHRQHKHVDMNRRRGLRVGGVVVPYWPSYYWGGGGMNPQPDSNNTGDSSGTTTDGTANAGDSGAAAGANA